MRSNEGNRIYEQAVVKQKSGMQERVDSKHLSGIAA